MITGSPKSEFFTSKTLMRRSCEMDFFRLVWKKSGLVHFQRPHGRGLSMKNVFLEPWCRCKDYGNLFAASLAAIYVVTSWRLTALKLILSQSLKLVICKYRKTIYYHIKDSFLVIFVWRKCWTATCGQKYQR